MIGGSGEDGWALGDSGLQLWQFLSGTVSGCTLPP